MSRDKALRTALSPVLTNGSSLNAHALLQTLLPNNARAIYDFHSKCIRKGGQHIVLIEDNKLNVGSTAERLSQVM